MVALPSRLTALLSSLTALPDKPGLSHNEITAYRIRSPPLVKSTWVLVGLLKMDFLLRITNRGHSTIIHKKPIVCK